MSAFTDRELLELAAKAADISIDPIDAAHDPSEWMAWNPLADDGDALRLAVKLGMEVYVDTHPDGCACTEAQSFTLLGACRSVVNHDGLGVAAATRRAIVVAAAHALQPNHESPANSKPGCTGGGG